MRVLVTGGTGTLGSAVVAQLKQRGHEPVIASRTAGPDRVVVDLGSGRGISRAADGAEAIVHLASDPGRHARTTDVDGTRNLAKTGLPVLFMSIVGVDEHPYRYYRIKREGEQVLESGQSGWTVLRATQFHAFIDVMLKLSLSAARRLPGNRSDDSRFLVPRAWRFQPVSHKEVAVHLVGLVEGGPTNSIEQFAGPQQLSSEELVAAWTTARGGRPVLVPTVGRSARAFKSGLVLAADGVPTGRETWSDYLNADD